jgi:adenosine deaminase
MRRRRVTASASGSWWRPTAMSDPRRRLHALPPRWAGEGVVSFGLDGDEAAFPPAPFAGAFEIARSAGLLATPHAGELLGPESVAAAMDRLHADRILHGVRAVEDSALLSRIASAGICLDLCPTSNAKLGVFEPGDHPLAALLRAGVRCSVNADDPLLFGVGLLDEYELCRTTFGLSDEELASIAAASILPPGRRRRSRQPQLIGLPDGWPPTSAARRSAQMI